MADLSGAVKGRYDEEFLDGLHLGDAIRFFLDAKRAGGRSERTLTEYRKKLDLFQRWAAARLEGEGAVDAPVPWVGPDEVEGYVVHMRGRGLSDTSIKNHLSVVRSFFDTLSKRLDLPDPTRRLDEVRFHQKDALGLQPPRERPCLGSPRRRGRRRSVRPRSAGALLNLAEQRPATGGRTAQ